MVSAARQLVSAPLQLHADKLGIGDLRSLEDIFRHSPPGVNNNINNFNNNNNNNGVNEKDVFELAHAHSGGGGGGSSFLDVVFPRMERDGPWQVSLSLEEL